MYLLLISPVIQWLRTLNLVFQCRHLHHRGPLKTHPHILYGHFDNGVFVVPASPSGNTLPGFHIGAFSLLPETPSPAFHLDTFSLPPEEAPTFEIGAFSLPVKKALVFHVSAFSLPLETPSTFEHTTFFLPPPVTPALKI